MDWYSLVMQFIVLAAGGTATVISFAKRQVLIGFAIVAIVWPVLPYMVLVVLQSSGPPDLGLQENIMLVYRILGVVHTLSAVLGYVLLAVAACQIAARENPRRGRYDEYLRARTMTVTRVRR